MSFLVKRTDSTTVTKGQTPVTYVVNRIVDFDVVQTGSGYNLPSIGPNEEFLVYNKTRANLDYQGGDIPALARFNYWMTKTSIPTLRDVLDGTVYNNRNIADHSESDRPLYKNVTELSDDLPGSTLPVSVLKNDIPWTDKTRKTSNFNPTYTNAADAKPAEVILEDGEIIIDDTGCAYDSNHAKAFFVNKNDQIVSTECIRVAASFNKISGGRGYIMLN